MHADLPLDVESARAPLRILVLSWRDLGHPEAGGSELFMVRAAAGLAGRGHDVTVLCGAYPGAAAEDHLEGVRYLRRGRRYSVYLHAARHLAANRDRYDVVLDIQNGVPFWAPLFTDVPVVNLVHHVHREQWRIFFGPGIAQLGWFLESRCAPAVYRRSPYLTVSEPTREELGRLGVAAERVQVVPVGFDPAPPADHVANAAPSLITVGRLVPHKRVELAVDAVATLRGRFPGLTLTVVGQGGWEEHIRAHAEQLGVADAVRFTGFVDEHTKNRLLAEAWVHALPSVKEGWGLVVLEAAAWGVPSVAFRDAGGTRDSVVDGVTGLLADDAADFTAKVATLLADRAERERMAVACREHSRSYTWDHTTRAVEAGLRAAVTGAPSDRVPAT
jgi:glycosyltransferase involved in cell wall biosynthesis